MESSSTEAGCEEDMAHMMGFSSFDTTKNKHVDGNAQGETKLNRPRKYRQYMNRRGGFNRPLDYIG
jgi:U4/U6.U5 tri-snRNP-associated protein 3